MKYLFIHQNFPGQFKTLAPKLVETGNSVTALTMRRDLPKSWSKIRIVPYSVERTSSKEIHPWLANLESQTIRGEACFKAAMQLKNSGYNPDKIIAHPGWGESLFLKEVWPDAKLGIYCEFFYHASGADVGFDPEFLSGDIAEPCRIAHKNLNNLAHFPIADAGISPTHWQASTFPESFREKITVVHDGIDTNTVKPDGSAIIKLTDGRALSKTDEIVTFINRNLEPYRGYHIFMRALPKMLRERPNARLF